MLFFVLLNLIDFLMVFEKFDIIGNGVVFGIVMVIIVLYVIGLLVGWCYDKKDWEKVLNFVFILWGLWWMYWCIVFLLWFLSVLYIKFWFVFLVLFKLKKEFFFFNSLRLLIKSIMMVRFGIWLNGFYK